MGKLACGLVCCLALLSRLSSAQQGGGVDGEPGTIDNPCAFTLCKEGTYCYVKDGEAVCKDDPCIATTCEEGSFCSVDEAGEPQCIKDPCAAANCDDESYCVIGENGEAECLKPEENPCNLVDCMPGTICVPQDGEGLCITSCATIKCAEDQMCIINDANNPECVEGEMHTMTCDLECSEGLVCMVEDDEPKCVEPPYDPCIATTCPENHACYTDENGQPVCMDVQTIFEPVQGEAGPNKDDSKACKLPCKKGYACKIKDGKRRCVKKPMYNPCAATTCPVGFLCVPKGRQGNCISACSTVKCRSGKCVLSKQGQPKCVAKKPPMTCAGMKCKKGTRCMVKDKKARCVNNCMGVKCRRGKRCIVSKNGKAVCVKPKPRLMM